MATPARGPAHSDGGTPTAPPDDAQTDALAARRLVSLALGVAALASGLLEYAGLGIAARHGGPLAPDALWNAWATGALRTLGAAVGAGVATAAVVGLRWRRWRRPWRAVSAGFALGAATVILVFALLVAWAP